MIVALFYIKSSGVSGLENQKCFYMLCQKDNLSFKAESLTMFLFFCADDPYNVLWGKMFYSVSLF